VDFSDPAIAAAILGVLGIVMGGLVTGFFALPRIRADVNKTNEEAQTSLEARLMAEINRMDAKLSALEAERDRLQSDLNTERVARQALSAALYESETIRRGMEKRIAELESSLSRKEKQIRELQTKVKRMDTGPL